MLSIQDVFNQIREAKKEQKEIKEEYKDALVQADEYEKIVDMMKQLREKKKQIEVRIQQQLGKRYERLEDLKGEIEANKEMMSDIAITTLMSGKTVEVTDEYQNKYEPVYNVKFKKTNAGETVGQEETKAEPEAGDVALEAVAA